MLATAPERQCGKSTLLNVIGTMTPRSLAASNASPAAIFRGIELWNPTLLLDEIDTWLPEKPELRGVINSGHERDQAYILRCVGDDHTPRRFSTWCPMVLSGIGKPADTIVSRSLVVSLRRRLPEERVERRPLDLRAKMLRVRRQCLRWYEDNRIRLGASEAEPPEIGDDRRRDNFIPLWRVAKALGGPWPERIAAAYVARGETDEAEESAGVMLLRDLMALFKREWPEPAGLTSSDIVTSLTADDEKPWGEWRRGKPATARTFAKLLDPYGVKPKPFRTREGKVAKGYVRADVQPAFDRYTSERLHGYKPEKKEKSSGANGYSNQPCNRYEAEKAQHNQARNRVTDSAADGGGYADPLDDPHNPEAW